MHIFYDILLLGSYDETEIPLELMTKMFIHRLIQKL